MANDIIGVVGYASGQNIYANIINRDRDYADIVAADGSFETFVVASIGTYDLALTETPASSQRYQVAFPAFIAAGRYKVEYYLDEADGAGTPAVGDTLLHNEYVDWDGSSLVDGVNIGALEGATSTLNNLADMYDGTGYTGDTAPASRSQVDSLAATGGAGAVPYAPSAITVTAGSGASGDSSDMENENDGNVYTVNDNAGTLTLDLDYQLPSTYQAVQLILVAAMQGNNDDVTIQFYDQVGAAYVTIDTIEGSNQLSYDTFDKVIVAKYTDSTGLFQMRLTGTGLSSATLTIDKAVAYGINTANALGFIDGAVWLDTANGTSGTAEGVGTVDNPSDNIEDAKTIAVANNLKRFHVLPGSFDTFTEAISGYEFMGFDYTLTLGGQNVASTLFRDAIIAGTGSGSNVTFRDCIMSAGSSTGPGRYVGCIWEGTSGSPWTANGSGEYKLIDPDSGVAGSATPYFDFSGQGATTGVNMRGHNGGTNITLDANNTLSLEISEGGGQTIVTGGADCEIRGLCRSLTVTVSASETVQFVGTTGPITITDNAATAPTVNLYGISSALTDGNPGTTNDYTVRGPDVMAILVDTNSLNDTKIPHTLNTTVSGNIGIDWASVENPTTAVDLSATDIQLCDTVTTLTNLPAIPTDWLTADGLAADAVVEIRDAITGGAYSLDTDANGRIRIVDGTAAGELDTVSGLVQLLAATQASIDAIEVDTSTTLPATLGTLAVADTVEGFFQIALRSDAAITTDRAAILTLINANEGTGVGDYAATTESQEALRDWIGDGTNLTEAGGDGDHLTAIDLPNQTMDIVGNITGNLSGSVGSVSGAVGSVAGNVDGNVTGSVGSVLGGLNTTAGTITTLDGLDTAQDSQHGTTQTAISNLNDYDGSDTSGTTTLLSRLTALRAGYLDNLSAGAVATASKVIKYFQLLFRKDAAIATDNATELTAINADEGSGAGSFDNTTESTQAIKDLGDVAWITATSVTVSDKTGFSLSSTGADLILKSSTFALAMADAVWDELLAGHVTADSAGLVLNDWQDGGRLDLLLDAIPTTAMRGTDGANTTVPDAAGTAATLHGITDGLVTTVDTVVDGIQTDLSNATDGLGALKTLIDAVQAAIDALQDLSASEVNAEMVDALSTDTYAEPGQGAPASTASLSAKIGYLFKAWRNKSTQTSTEYNLFADDTTTVDHQAITTDDGTTATKNEVITGP